MTTDEMPVVQHLIDCPGECLHMTSRDERPAGHGRFVHLDERRRWENTCCNCGAAIDMPIDWRPSPPHPTRPLPDTLSYEYEHRNDPGTPFRDPGWGFMLVLLGVIVVCAIIVAAALS